MEQQTPPETMRNPERDDITLGEDLRLLAGEAKVLARAELAFQKSRAAYASRQVRKIVALAIVTLGLVLVAAMAFVVGLVIALAHLLGPWGAMVVVTLGLLGVAAACAFVARRTLLSTKRVILDTSSGGPQR